MARMRKFLLDGCDWINGCRKLSAETERFYLRLMIAYYANGGPLPYDEQDLCAVLHYKNVRSVRAPLRDLFHHGKLQVIEIDGENYLSNERADAEIVQYEARYQARIEAAARGGRAAGVTKRGQAKGACKGGETAIQVDISPISTSYQPHFDSEIEENQGVNVSKLITYKNNNSACASVCEPAHEAGARVDEPAVEVKPVNAVPANNETAMPANDEPLPLLPPVDAIEAYGRLKFGPNRATAQTVIPVPALSPEQQALRAQVLELGAWMTRRLVETGVSDETNLWSFNHFEGWLKEGYDPDMEIRQGIEEGIAFLVDQGQRLTSMNFFLGYVTRVVDRRKRVADKIAEQPAKDAARRSGKGYKGYNGAGRRSSGDGDVEHRPFTAEPADAALYRRVYGDAARNGHEDILDEIEALNARKRAGDPEASRLLKEFLVKNVDVVTKDPVRRFGASAA